MSETDRVGARNREFLVAPEYTNLFFFINNQRNWVLEHTANWKMINRRGNKG